jgi:hypothetical protein
VDVIIRRYHAATGQGALLVETFEALAAADRSRDRALAPRSAGSNKDCNCRGLHTKNSQLFIGDRLLLSNVSRSAVERQFIRRRRGVV